MPKPLQTRRLPTLVVALFVVFAWVLNDFVLAWVHDQAPLDIRPLPDLSFRFLPEITAVMRVAEIIMLVLTISGLAVMLLHQHRWIVTRRVLFITAICYTFRAFCIVLIQVPVPSKKTYCGPQQNSSIQVLVERTVGMFWSAGIEQFKKRDLCGDLIVSGHTLTIFISVMAFRQYSPRHFKYLGIIYNALAFVAILCILFARKHYTFDIFLGYLTATRTFWTYHALMNSYHDNTLDRNPLTRSLWASLVPWLERDSPPPGLFLNVLQWPSSCPQKIRRRFSL